MRDKITPRQAACMLLLFELGSSLVTGGSMKAEQDSWFTALIGLAMSVPLLLLYARLHALCPDGDLYDMACQALGKPVGSAVTLAFSLYAFHLGGLVIRNFTEYIQVLSLPETPQPVCAVCIAALAYLSIRSGLEVPARSAEFVTPIACAIVGILLALTANKMDFSNLRPVLGHDPRLLLSDGYASLTFPFGESVLFLSVFCAVKEPSSSYRKCYLWGVLLAGAILTVLIAGNIAVLGVPIARALFFPSYETVGMVDVGNFISRIEVLVSGNFVIFGLMKVTVCLYVGCRGVSRVLGGKGFQAAAAIAAAGMVVFSQMVYSSTMQMFTFLDLYKRYAPAFEIALPLVLLLGLRRRQSAPGAAQQPANVPKTEQIPPKTSETDR